MKSFIFIFAACFALTWAADIEQRQIHIPEKCSDVLAVKVCDRLYATAAKLKVKSEEVTKFVIETYKQGKVTAEELYQKTKDFIVNEVMTKKCEDLTSVENCNKLRKLAADLKVEADKVAEFIVKQIAILKTKECEDFLTADQCQEVKDLAKKLKIKAEQLEDFITDAVIDAKVKATDYITETYNKIKEYVKATRCEDMFNPDVCIAFRKYAEKTKVALPKIMETAFEVAKKGVAIGKDLVTKVFNIVDYFYDCTDVFDQKSCDRLESWAKKVAATAEEVERLMKKYIRIFIEKGTPIWQSLKDFVREHIYCKFYPSDSKCLNVVMFDDLDDELVVSKRGLFGDWKQKAKDLLDQYYPDLEENLRAKLDEIINKSKNIFEYMKNLYKELKGKASAKLREIINKLMVETQF